MNRQTTSPAFARQSASEETKPTFMMRLAKVFRRRKKVLVESHSLTSAVKALIANLMAMR